MAKSRSRGKAQQQSRKSLGSIYAKRDKPFRRQSGCAQTGATWITQAEAEADRRFVTHRTAALKLANTLRKTAATKAAAIKKAAAVRRAAEERAAYLQCGVVHCENTMDFLPCKDCKKGLCNSCGSKMVQFRNKRCPFCGRHASVRPGTIRPDFKS